MIYTFKERKPHFDSTDYYVAPSAQIIGSVRFGAWSSVWFGAVLRGDSEWIEVGERSNIQDGAVVHAEPGLPTTLGAGVSVGHLAMLHGCVIESGSLVGNGAIVLDGAHIGTACVIAAGSLVPPRKTIPDGVVLMGSPARIVRESTDADREMIEHASAHYVEWVALYRSALRELSASTPR